MAFGKGVSGGHFHVVAGSRFRLFFLFLFSRFNRLLAMRPAELSAQVFVVDCSHMYVDSILFTPFSFFSFLGQGFAFFAVARVEYGFYRRVK